jgi:PAS domain S-box-containing protein
VKDFSTFSLAGSSTAIRDRDALYRAFLATVILAGSFVLAWSLLTLSAQPIALEWLMLVLLTGVSGWATLRLRAIPASFSISDTFTIAAALLFGPAAGAVTVAVDALVMSLRLAAGGRQPAPVRVLFNVTVPALTMWIAAQMFFASADVGPLAHAPGTIRRVLAPLGLFALLYFVLNTGLVATAVALERRANVVSIWRDHFAPLWLTYFGGASLAALFVLMAVAQVIDLSALMLVLPLVVVLHLAYRAALDRANERLEHLASIASYATALRATADGVLIIGRDRHTTFMNAAAEWLTGWTEAHAIGRHVAEVLQTRDPVSGHRHDALTTDEGSLHDYLLLDRGGNRRQVEIMHASIRNEAGESSGAILTFRDVSERLAANAERDALLQREQRARLAADAASRLKDEFLTTLSHELRTPANGILGWVRLLRTGRLTSAQIEAALEALERSAKAQAALIEDLLDVSRIVDGTMRFAFEAARVPDLLAAALAVLRPGADAKGVSISLTTAAAIPSVQADPARLRQVFWNLLSNAIKFTDRGGEVTVRVGVDEYAVIVEIRDTGRGIDPAALPVIFDRFRQADGSSTRSHGGLGLGLSIVRHIVEAHGGTVTASSDGAGHGACFTVRLQIAAETDRSRQTGGDPSVTPDDGIEQKRE